MKKQLLIGALIGALVVAVLAALIFWLRPAPAPAPEMPSSAQPGLATPAPNPASAATAPSAAMPPPWMNAPGAAAPKAANPERVRELRAVQARLSSLMAGGRKPDPKELNAVLDDLIRIQGTTVIGGVDFAVLKNNLAKSQEIEALAREMEQVSKQPKPDAKRIQALMEKIQAAQAGLRSDVMAPSPAAAAQKP